MKRTIAKTSKRAKRPKKPKAPNRPKLATAKAKTRARQPRLIFSTGPAERMTAEQEARLRKLAYDSYELDAFSSRLTQTEAATRIAMLEAKLPLQDGPPHTL
jgi:hypothetical protein